MTAYWQKLDEERASYEIEFNPCHKGQRGYHKYQAAMAAIAEITRTLAVEGFKLKFKK